MSKVRKPSSAWQRNRESTHNPLVPEFDDTGLCLLESLHASDFRMEWTRHPFLKIIAPLRGRGEILTQSGIDPTVFRLVPGRVAVVFGGVTHRIRDDPGEPLLLYVLCIGSGFPFPGAGRVSPGVRWVDEHATSGKALQSLREIASLPRKMGTGNSGKMTLESQRLIRCGLAATLLGRLLDEPAIPAGTEATPDSRSRVHTFIQRLPREFFTARSIDAAAAELCLSRRRFTQLFNELAGESYVSRIQRLRLAHAGGLLREGKSPLTVAFECGYGDPSTFYRAFKKSTDFSPSRWNAQRPPAVPKDRNQPSL